MYVSTVYLIFYEHEWKFCFYQDPEFEGYEIDLGIWGTYPNAESVCKKEGGNLASITSAAENDFLAQLVHTGITYPKADQGQVVGCCWYNVLVLVIIVDPYTII